jgi:hypothetical protein
MLTIGLRDSGTSRDRTAKPHFSTSATTRRSARGAVSTDVGGRKQDVARGYLFVAEGPLSGRWLPGCTPKRTIVTELGRRGQRHVGAARLQLSLPHVHRTRRLERVRRRDVRSVWKIIKDLGKRVGVDTIHPHAFSHACGVELLKRSGGNLRAAQEHLRHADIQTTTIYTRLAPQDLQKVVNLFDEKNGGGAR